MSKMLARGLMAHASASVMASVLTVFIAGPAAAAGLPGAGHYTAGHGALSRSHGVLTIDQSSRSGIIDWKSFSVGKNNRIDFNNSGGATLNIVTGGNLSRIAGQLHATGSVYLINRTGVVVTGTGRVVTTGNFGVSGRNADSDAFTNGGPLHFTGGVSGRVVNNGRITAANGDVSLHGRNVLNAGAIAANNAILMASRATRVTGSIDVKNNVETSGARTAFGGARISGRSWLVDPENLTVNASAADTIEASLNGGTDVTLQTDGTTASGPGKVTDGAGDIIIAAPITWSTTAMLTVESSASLIINKNIHVAGAGGLSLDWATYPRNENLFFNNAHITFTDVAGGEVQGSLTMNDASYTLVNSMSQLQNINRSNAALSETYALARSLNASSVSGWVPIGTNGRGTVRNYGHGFAGGFDGLGNTISNLKVNIGEHDYAGLFGFAAGFVGNGAMQIRNIGMIGGSVHGRNAVGGLVGFSQGGGISDSFTTGDVKGQADVGGLIGMDFGLTTDSHATGSVTGNSAVGGLAGEEDGILTRSFATATVKGQAAVGGLAGQAYGTISQSYAAGSVTGGDLVGGLVGANNLQITDSYATGAVTGSTSVGGLVGQNAHGPIATSYSTGAVEGQALAGGLIGRNLGGTITHSYWDTQTSGQSASAGGTARTTAQLTGKLPAGFSDTFWGTTPGGLPYLLWSQLSAALPPPPPPPR